MTTKPLMNSAIAESQDYVHNLELENQRLRRKLEATEAQYVDARAVALTALHKLHIATLVEKYARHEEISERMLRELGIPRPRANLKKFAEDFGINLEDIESTLKEDTGKKDT